MSSSDMASMPSSNVDAQRRQLERERFERVVSIPFTLAAAEMRHSDGAHRLNRRLRDCWHLEVCT